MFLFATIAAVVLVGLYLFTTDASPVSKGVVAVLLLASFVVAWRFPQVWVVTLLVRVGLGVFVLIYLKAVAAGL